MNQNLQTKEKNMKEQHRYLYNLENDLEYLIIGTIHPNSKPILDYFYGNVASFWKILENIYKKHSFNTISGIKQWQSEYKIGITDTVVQCKRAKQTAKDKDLLLEDEDYNWLLKKYILRRGNGLKKLLLTSGDGENGAYKNLKKIMGEEFELIKNKCIILPSPSGNSNLALFKGPKEFYGLVEPFYNFLKENHNDAIIRAKQTYEQKIVKGQKIKRLPNNKDYCNLYKINVYQKLLPK